MKSSICMSYEFEFAEKIAGEGGRKKETKVKVPTPVDRFMWINKYGPVIGVAYLRMVSEFYYAYDYNKLLCILRLMRNPLAQCKTEAMNLFHLTCSYTDGSDLLPRAYFIYQVKPKNKS